MSQQLELKVLEKLITGPITYLQLLTVAGVVEGEEESSQVTCRVAPGVVQVVRDAVQLGVQGA